MTVMGMAASQARFLGLTARKSNVEYQGQQVNQQRTALANESANLYNQMMTLDVPTPPATTDYYKTTYELENSTAPYATGNYTIEGATKTYNNTNDEYRVTLGYQTQTNIAQDYNVRVGTTTSSTQVISNGEGENAQTTSYTQYKFKLTDNAINYNFTLTLNDYENGLNAYTGVKTEDGKNALSTVDGVIYKVDPERDLTGKNECCTDSSKTYYFYKIKENTYFLTEEDINKLKQQTSGVSEADKIDSITYKKSATKTDNKTTEVIARMEKSSTGRFSSISINESGEYPADLSGADFNLNVKQVFDQSGYDNAMNDYNFQKDVYEKAISDINAKTEVIQKQDQNLELRLDQLDTEQNAIKTEMDAVQKVIDDNVEKTFKTFSA